MSLLIGRVKGYGEQDNFYEAGIMKELDYMGKKSMLKSYGKKILKNIMSGKNGVLSWIYCLIFSALMIIL